MKLVRFRADDPMGLWKKGDLADSLGQESPGVPVWLFRLHRTDEVIALEGPDLGFIEEVAEVAPLPSPDENTEGKSHALWRGAPDTERNAAALVAPRSGHARRKVLDALAVRHPNGLTDYEIANVTGLRLYTAAPRRTELVSQGWVMDSGRRRPTDSGTPAAVWVLTPQGEKEYQPS